MGMPTSFRTRNKSRLTRLLRYLYAKVLRLTTRKIISHGRDRKEAISRLDAALRETVLDGVDTLIPLHRKILEEPNFLKKNVTISYLEDHNFG